MLWLGLSRQFLSSARKKKCEQNHSKKAKPRFCLFHFTARSCTGKGEFARRFYSKQIFKKRQNHAFAFFTLQRGAAQGKVNLRGVYKREPLKCRAKRKTPRLAEGRPAGLSYPHGVPQAAACRGTRELKSLKEAKRRFCLFSLVSIRMEVNFFAVYKT